MAAPTTSIVPIKAVSITPTEVTTRVTTTTPVASVVDLEAECARPAPEALPVAVVLRPIKLRAPAAAPAAVAAAAPRLPLGLLLAHPVAEHVADGLH
jgi:hypothetical protein